MQRRFGMGFSKAGGIMDKMDRMGFVSPSEGSNKPRKVLLSREEFVERFGEVPPENPSDLF
jgi:S-DNA-T family DNA segregation ATPase FtsK/SpoIIIE